MDLEGAGRGGGTFVSGGFWLTQSGEIRSASRNLDDPDLRSSYVGQLFRAFCPASALATDVMGWETALVECAHPLTRHLSEEHHRCQEIAAFW